MKKTIFILIVILTQICSVSAQDTIKVNKYVNAYDSLGTICATSRHKDTLYIPNDAMGKLIKKVWEEKPLDKNPIIIVILEQEQLLAMIRRQKKFER